MDPARRGASVRTMQYGVVCYKGRMIIQRLRDELRELGPPASEWYYGHNNHFMTITGAAPPIDLVTHGLAGVRYGHRIDKLTWGWTSNIWLTLPLWLFLPTAIPPVVWLQNRRKQRQSGFPVTLAGAAPPNSH
jgi:hypothetical protein